MSLRDENFSTKAESEGSMREGESIYEDEQGNQFRLENNTLKLVRVGKKSPDETHDEQLADLKDTAKTQKLFIDATRETRTSIDKLADTLIKWTERMELGLGNSQIVTNMASIPTPGNVKKEKNQSYLITGNPSKFLKEQSRSRNPAERQAAASAERVAAQQEAQIRRSQEVFTSSDEEESRQKGKRPAARR